MDDIPGSMDPNKEALIAELTKINYEVPNVLDAVTAFFMHFIRFGKTFSNITLCQEEILELEGKVIVNGFPPTVIVALKPALDSGRIVIAPMKKFF